MIKMNGPSQMADSVDDRGLEKDRACTNHDILIAPVIRLQQMAGTSPILYQQEIEQWQ